MQLLRSLPGPASSLSPPCFVFLHHLRVFACCPKCNALACPTHHPPPCAMRRPTPKHPNHSPPLARASAGRLVQCTARRAQSAGGALRRDAEREARPRGAGSLRERHHAQWRRSGQVERHGRRRCPAGGAAARVGPGLGSARQRPRWRPRRRRRWLRQHDRFIRRWRWRYARRHGRRPALVQQRRAARHRRAARLLVWAALGRPVRPVHTLLWARERRLSAHLPRLRHRAGRIDAPRGPSRPRERVMGAGGCAGLVGDRGGA